MSEEFFKLIMDEQTVLLILKIIGYFFGSAILFEILYRVQIQAHPKLSVSIFTGSTLLALIWPATIAVLGFFAIQMMLTRGEKIYRKLIDENENRNESKKQDVETSGEQEK